MGIESKPRRRWTPQDVINELKNSPQITAKAVQRSNPSLYGAAVRHFGSWRRAVEVAGLKYEEVMKRRPQGSWDTEKVLHEISALSELTSNRVRKSAPALYSAALRIFGGWEAAIVAAGLDYEWIRRPGGKRRSADPGGSE